ncbi:Ldh family oxidoreductase [Microbacterium sp. SSM24]|uniref:Ldh family oxidoreductase n=1 Tax=Microbacterium sp. SSM24 TaxID=2991714 RepID=UPI0022274A0D|nr:Ldh family oxidoreductase [Microbacterium sp. SSM24]MCW3492579.1 Ldh family oxidoreductase [Microbacterium sp. SSM24]
MSAPRFDHNDCHRLASQLLVHRGLIPEAAVAVARTLVEADLLGHDTHGLALLARYLDDLESGAMNADPSPVIVRDTGPTVVWDAEWRSGVWTTIRAVDEAVDRALRFGIAAVAVRRAHHIACLQAYLEQATRRGIVVSITCSDPSAATVVPFGGRDAVFQPDPIAFGIPTDGDPILIDMSTSITSNAIVARAAAEGQPLPGEWVQDRDGTPTNDASVVSGGGALLPVGGSDHGHKGFNLALIVESLTQGLAGFGRAGAPERWTADVLVQAWDPDAFSGSGSFTAATSEIVRRVRDSSPIQASAPVRLPGQAALARKRRALDDGLVLAPQIAESLSRLALGSGFEPLVALDSGGDRP